MPSPRVALAMIVRDEQRSLGRALDSAMALFDEVVVVDTGSRDAAVTIALDHGARVCHVPWTDDFAAARNAALGATHADFTAMIDADEWIEPRTVDPVREWAAQATPLTAGSFTIVSDAESEGHVLRTRADIVRVLPRGCRFEGRIHEQATGFAQLIPVTGLLVRHDGYRSAQLARKKGRNERLLRALLVETPDDPYRRFQLGRERQIAGDPTEAATCYLAALPHVDDTTPWGDELRSRLIFCLHRSGRTQEAWELTTTLLRRSPSAEVLFAAGNFFLDLAVAMPARRHRFLSMARHAWQACLDLGDPTDGRDYTPGCGSFLAAENLAALCRSQGEEAEYRQWTRRGQELRARNP